VLGVVWGEVWGVALIVEWGVVLGVALGRDLGVTLTSVVLGVVLSMTMSAVSGLRWGLYRVWCCSSCWRGCGRSGELFATYRSYPFCLLWNNLLYQLDKRQTNRKFSRLLWNCAFWDELQHLPLHSLDKHLLLVMESHQQKAKLLSNI
jgi:hypothetical protein